LSNTNPNTDTNISHEIQRRHREAQQHLNRGRLPEAQQCCLRVLADDPNHADAHFLLGMITVAGQRYKEAIGLLERAIVLDDQRAEYHAQLGRCLVTLKRVNEARNAADRAMQLNPGNALTLDTIGCVYSRTGDHDRAVAPFRKAIRKQPLNSNFQFNLAASLEFLGEFDGAEAAYEKAARSTPRYYKAHWALSHLRRQTPERNHTERLEKLLADIGADLPSELRLRNALAKEYDDIGEYDRAFEHMAAGYAKLRRQLNYSIADDEAVIDRITAAFDEDLLSHPPAGHPSAEPIFVVGMPRTGTTLVERIVSSHSEVYSAGELQTLSLVIKRAAQTKSNKVLDSETVEQGLKADFGVLGHDYLQSNRPVTGHTPHFIDKMPLNFFNIGFIHLALPDAKIICLRRHPLDACLSNYRQLFALTDSPYYHYSYDLLDTGRYYILFHRLMEHWRRVLPGKVLEIQYEELVADQETQSRRLIEHCGLDWQDACLAFEKNPAPVATASSAQVREPIYTRAVERWRHYEKHLAPLRELLEQSGIEVA
jgi:tetratricopeptide (TPR) repeat protein